jgi:hypothetical protein
VSGDAEASCRSGQQLALHAGCTHARSYTRGRRKFDVCHPRIARTMTQQCSSTVTERINVEAHGTWMRKKVWMCHRDSSGTILQRQPVFFQDPTRALLLAHGNTVELWNACWMCSHSHMVLVLDVGAAHDVCAAQLFRWPLLPRRPGCLGAGWLAARMVRSPPFGQVTQ